MEHEDGGQGSGDSNRPRRPNPDTISYLRSLPLDIQTCADEVSRFVSSEIAAEQEYPQSFAAALAAIEESRNELASLAGDEFGSQCVEILTRMAAPYSTVASLTLLKGLKGFHLFLATHRYGSHVVQTILQLSVSSTLDTDLALHAEAPQLTRDGLPTLSDLILGLVEELTPHAKLLAVHVCGSHVLRTLLCVLGRVQLVQSPGRADGNRIMESGAIRRGKFKNKQKKKKHQSADTSSPPHAGMMHMVYQNNSRLDKTSDASFSHALQTLTEALSGSTTSLECPGELQQMACHPSAGPLLIVLLRVLTYSSNSQKQHRPSGDDSHSIADHRLGVNRPEPIFEIDSPAHALVQRILCWQPTEPSSQQEYARDIIYGLSGEPRGSHVLETLMRISPDEVYASILQCGDFVTPSTLQEYVEHDVSNFVIQTLLSTVRTREQAEMLLKSLDRTISSGYAVDPQKKRRGILWRAVEMAAKYRVGQDALIKSIRMGFAALASRGDEGQADHANKTEETTKRKKRIKASAVSIQDCVSQLLDLKPPDRDGGRVLIDVAGARAVHHLLKFVPRLCEDVLNGIILGMSKEELEMIARDGLGSRCIMDGILEGHMEEAIFSKAAKVLQVKLSGRWVALSVERVGHHTVKKLFRALPNMDDKAVLAEELAHGANRLSGNAMGRSVMEACAVKEFMEGEKAWKEAVTKLLRKEVWLKELSANGDRDKETSKAGKKKRKRKRHGTKLSSDAEKDEVADGSSTIASIMKAISVPASTVQD